MGIWIVIQTIGQTGWKQYTATILSSRIDEHFDTRNNRHFKVLLRYEYEVAGKKHRGDVIRAPIKFMGADHGSQDYQRAEAEFRQYAPGTKVTCFVNPRDPGEVCLQRSSVTFGIVVFLAPAFILSLYWLKGRFLERLSAKPHKRKPAGVRNARLREGWGLIWIGAALALMGGACSYYTEVQAWLKCRGAQSWPAVACVIIESGTQETNIKGRPYKPDVLYEFEVHGKKYRSNKTHFDSAEPESYSDCVRFAKRFDPGRAATCYVNPANPQESVLDRSFAFVSSWSALIGFGMCGGGLLAIGLGIHLILSERRVLAAPLEQRISKWAGTPNPNPVHLRPLSSYFWVWLCTIAGLMACAGVLAWRVGRFVKNWKEVGTIEFSIFDIFLVIAVVAATAWLGTQFLSFFSPYPTLRVAPGSPALGESFDLEWEFHGATRRLRDVKIRLEAREEAITDQTRGNPYDANNKIQHKAVFYSQVVAAPLQLEGRLHGHARVVLPAGLMPTFKGSKTFIIWALAVEGEVSWGPAMKHLFTIEALPERTALAA
jgi:hypothetical protein